MQEEKFVSLLFKQHETCPTGTVDHAPTIQYPCILTVVKPSKKESLRMSDSVPTILVAENISRVCKVGQSRHHIHILNAALRIVSIEAGIRRMRRASGRRP